MDTVLEVQGILVSTELLNAHFVCDLAACKGACCLEGDLGAPLSDEETKIMPAVFEAAKGYLSEEGLKAIDSQGLYILDQDGDYSTPTVGGRECAYVVRDATGTLKCGIESAYLDGATDFRKPISCHLYPIRVSKKATFDFLQYHRWSICSQACTLGSALRVPVYVFLKEALVRCYGTAWYEELASQAKQLMKINGESSSEHRANAR